ncbi:phosphate ABC transporter substrate-binding protein [bacterium]|nr:phosphate ABC transporter substrate-binding protein [bacterium]
MPVLLVTFVTSCARPVNEESQIQVTGSDTMVNLGQAWAEAYMFESPETFIAVGGGGSGVGIAALINGTADLAHASRSMKEKESAKAEENGIHPQEHIVGYDGLAVVVHPDNPVNELTLLQLAKIFSGEITNWNELGGEDLGIVLLSREVNSGTHVYFKDNVLGVAEEGTEFSENALLMPSSQSIADEVGQNTGAIGYYGMGYISPQQRPVAVGTSEGFVLPTVANVVNKSYPIARPLFIYTNGAPEGTIRAYIDWILSESGQAVVTAQDFVPIL